MGITTENTPQLNILFNPEFLTERSTNFDFINQSHLRSWK